MSCPAGLKSIRRSKRRSTSVEESHAAERSTLEKSIPRHIARYFCDLPVPDIFDIQDRKYVDLCLETSMCDAADMAYKAIASSGRFRSSCSEGMIAEDIMLVIGILGRLRAKSIPQEFSPGMMLMHLEILEGISFSNAT